MDIQNTKQGYHISMGADSQYYILNNGEDFIKNLERKKSSVKPTEPVPFTFHEAKV